MRHGARIDLADIAFGIKFVHLCSIADGRTPSILKKAGFRNDPTKFHLGQSELHSQWKDCICRKEL